MTRTILVAAVVAAAIATGGCALTSGFDVQSQRSYELASEDFTTTVQSLTVFYEAGKIDEELWQTAIVPLIEEGDALLDRWEAALAAGEVDAAEVLRPALRGLVIRLSVYLATQ